MSLALRQVRDADGAAEEVQMNAVACIEWTAGRQYLYTQALNSCTAVAITSEHAGILAHIGPSRGNTSGKQNVIDHMQQVINFYKRGHSNGLFSRTSNIVMVAIYQGAAALPEQIDVIRAVLHKLELPVTYKEYRVRGMDEDRMAGETSLVIHCAPGNTPQFYINEALWRPEGDHSVGSSSVGSTEEVRRVESTPNSMTVREASAPQDHQQSRQSVEYRNRHAAESVSSARAALQRMITQGTRRGDALAQVRGLLAGELHITEEQAGKYLLTSAGHEHGEPSSGRAEWNQYATSRIQHARAVRDRLVMQGVSAAAAAAQVQPVLAQQLHITEAQAAAYLG